VLNLVRKQYILSEFLVDEILRKKSICTIKTHGLLYKYGLLYDPSDKSASSEEWITPCVCGREFKLKRFLCEIS
jgi:hypothetical protein